MIEGRDLGQAEAFGELDQSGVYAAEVLVGVLVGRIGNPSPIASCEVLDEQLAVRYRPVERRLGGGAELAVDQLAGLCKDQLGGDEGTRVGLE